VGAEIAANSSCFRLRAVGSGPVQRASNSSNVMVILSRRGRQSRDVYLLAARSGKAFRDRCTIMSDPQRPGKVCAPRIKLHTLPLTRLEVDAPLTHSTRIILDTISLPCRDDAMATSLKHGLAWAGYKFTSTVLESAHSPRADPF
jgi:hypothetical protein